jgi:Fic family protein
MTFSFQEERIIRALYRAGRPLTTSKAAQKAQMSWPTADKYLNQLREKGVVIRKSIGKSTYWRIR